MQLLKIREIMILFDIFNMYKEQEGAIIKMRFTKAEKECTRTFKTINNMTMDKNLNLRVDCQLNNRKRTVLTFNKKAECEKKISNLSIIIFINGKNFLEYPENIKEKNGE